MRAIVQQAFGGPENLIVAEVPLPEYGPHDLLIQVRAIGLNPIDTKARENVAGWGALQGSQPTVLGWDCAGVVVNAGAIAGTRFLVGDHVWFAGSLTRAGCQAQYTVVDARLVAKMPKNLSFAQAAAMPLTALTVWEGLIERCGLVAHSQSNGSKVALVIGGAGGVGAMAIQFLKRVCGLRVIATASRDESRAYCRQLGADEVIDHHGDLHANAKAAGIPQVDILLCTNDPHAYFDTMSALLAPGGQICLILPLMGSINSFGLFNLHASLHFEFIFSRPILNVEMHRHGEILATIATFVEHEALRSTLTVQRPWTLENVVEAHRQIEAGHSCGKTVFVVAEE